MFRNTGYILSRWMKNNFEKILMYGILIILMVTMLSCSAENKAGSSDNRRSETGEKEKKETLQTETPENETATGYNDHIRNDHIAEVVKTIDHDPDAYTQGFLYHGGYFYESTGLREKSSLRKLNPNTGKVLKKKMVPGNYFAEGMTIFNDNDKIYQLTWRGGICFVYDLNSFEILENRNYPGEGWGLTDNGEHLIMSDGSDIIRFIDPETFEIVRQIRAYNKNKRISYLNELEYIKGEIYANVYGKDQIVRINPQTGEVFGTIDLSPLREYVDPTMDVEVLNGIAWDSEKERLYVTGKNWHFIFLINLKDI